MMQIILSYDRTFDRHSPLVSSIIPFLFSFVVTNLEAPQMKFSYDSKETTKIQ